MNKSFWIIYGFSGYQMQICLVHIWLINEIFDFGVHYKLHKLIVQFKYTFNVKDINLFNYLLIDL